MNRKFEENIKECGEVIKNEGVVIYPADTVYGIGCLATSEKAIKALYQIKGRNENQASLVLIDQLDRLKPYLSKELSRDEIDQIKNPEPTTVILNDCIGLPKILLGPEDSLGVRLIQNDHLIKLIQNIGAPLVSTSANFSGEPTPLAFQEVSPLLISKLDYTLKNEELQLTGKPSRIVKFTDNKLEIIRA